MSTPESGIVEIFAGVSGASGITDAVQASGVLIAPDEVLTAAHVVEDLSGLRSDIYVETGMGGQAVPPVAEWSISGIHADPAYVVGSGSLTNSANDLALIHLSTPVSGTVYALGTAPVGGTLTVGGYPAGTGSTYDEATETFTPDPSVSGVLDGDTLGGGGDPHGSSGGPVWDTRSGVPTVVGLVSGGALDANGQPIADDGYFAQLTAAKIAEIQAWISADQSVVASNVPATPASVAPVSPATPVVVPTIPAPAAAIPAPTVVPTIPATAIPTQAPAIVSAIPAIGAGPEPAPVETDPTAGLRSIAAAIASAASGAPTIRQTAMFDVSAAIGIAASEGDVSLGQGADDTARAIRADSWAPRRALAYLGGLLSAFDGAGRPDAPGFAAATFPWLASAASPRVIGSLASAGWTEGSALSSAQADGSSSMSDLAAAIGQPGGWSELVASPLSSSPAGLLPSALIAPAHAHPG